MFIFMNVLLMCKGRGTELVSELVGGICGDLQSCEAWRVRLQKILGRCRFLLAKQYLLALPQLTALKQLMGHIPSVLYSKGFGCFSKKINAFCLPFVSGSYK